MRWTDVLRHLDLFSGIGGFSLGLERTGGFETIGFCEINPFCQKVLAKYWPDVPIHDDVRTINDWLEANNIRFDVLTGGYPCQPFSHAGKRRGTEDDRYLWPQMFEVIKAQRPTWLIIENVIGLLSMGLADGKPQVESRTLIRTADEDNYLSVLTLEERLLLGTQIDELEAEAYAVQPLTVPACAVDAKHRRDRVWIVAHTSRFLEGRKIERPKRQRTREGGQSKPLADAERKPKRSGLCSGGSGRERGRPPLPGRRPRDVPDAVKFDDDWRGHGTGRDCGEFIGPAELSRRQSGHAWLPEPNVGRVAHGVPNRVDRLRGLGNAVIPQIPEAIGRAILNAQD